MKYKIIIIALLFGSSSLCAQNIENMAGIRLGGTTALTYKKMFANLEAAEVMLSNRESGLQIVGLYEKHKPITTGWGENFFGYYGFGGHLGYAQSNPILLRTDTGGVLQTTILDIGRKTFFVMGVDAIFGLEYHVYSIPMAFAMDFKPTIELLGMRSVRSRVFDFGVSAKYIF